MEQVDSFLSTEISPLSLEKLQCDNQSLKQLLADSQSTIARLQKETDYLRAQLGASSEGILVMTDTFVDCNQSTCRIWRADRGDIIGSSPVDFAPEFQANGERSSDVARRRIQAALDGAPQRFFWKDMKKDGTIFDSEVTLRAVEVGDEEYVVATVRDVTEAKIKEDESRKLFVELEQIQKKRNAELARFHRELHDARTSQNRMKQALNDADRELSKVFETSGDGLVVVDSNQNIQRINATYSQLSGYSQKDIANKKCYQIFSCKGCVGTTCKVASMLENSDRIEYETVCRNASGEIVPCILSATSLRDSSGNVIGMVQNYRNITTFKNWVEELKYSEELYRAILSNTSDVIIITDDDGHIFFASHSVSAQFGYGLDEVWAMENVSQLLGRFYSLERLKAEEVIRNIELSVKDRNGIPHDLIVTVSRVNIRGATVLISCHDITEKIAAEEEARIRDLQLEQASKMVSLGILVSGVAHEINNPNNFIMLNTPLLSRVWTDACHILDDRLEAEGDFVLSNLSYLRNKERIADLFNGVLEGSQRIKRIVSDMKRYARQGGSDLDQAVYLNSVIKHSLSLLNNQIRTATNSHVIEYGEGKPNIKGNFQKVEQVVVNLVQNACEALPEKNCGLKICTYLDTTQGTASIIVEDEGVGIPSNHVDHIMDPFFTTKRSCGGTGLGLSISQRIMKEHGGRLQIVSVVGKGTRAEAIFPLHLSDI